jgi:hypothetical protein
MSRWSKRSQEEKQRIYDDQMTKSQEVHERSTFDSSPEKLMKIYNNRELPLMCFRHGWVASKQYVLMTELDVLTRKPVPTLKGVCPHCGRPLKRALNPLSDMGMVDASIFFILMKDRRLKDNR